MATVAVPDGQVAELVQDLHGDRRCDDRITGSVGGLLHDDQLVRGRRFDGGDPGPLVNFGLLAVRVGVPILVSP